MEELYKDLREEVEPLLAERRFEAIKQILSANNAQDIAELITHQPPKEQVLLFRLLAKELAAGGYRFSQDFGYQASYNHHVRPFYYNNGRCAGGIHLFPGGPFYPV
jgi:hypothetical protein